MKLLTYTSSSHCAVEAGKFTRSLPARQKTTVADLIAALKSAFDTAVEDETREAKSHRAMLELSQRNGEGPAKYVVEFVTFRNISIPNKITPWPSSFETASKARHYKCPLQETLPWLATVCGRGNPVF